VADRQRTVSILIEAKNAASNALGAVGLSLGAVAAAAAAAGAALTAIIGVMAKATAAAAEQEKADVRLATALASIGQNSEATRADLADFVDGLEDATKVSDETIASVLSLLSQFGRLEGEGLKRATRATLDYAAATGQDATSAAEQLANVIVKGQGRLKGINTLFEEGTSKAARYASVLQQVEDKTRGTAEAHGKTFEGALSQVGIEMERLLELLGKSVVENVAVRDAVAQMAATIKAAAGFIREHRQEFDALVTVIGKVAEAALVAVPKMLQFSAMVVQFIPGGQALTSILRLMKMALKEVETETVDTAAGIRNVGAGAAGAGEAMKNAFDRLDFDIKLLSDLKKEAADVTEVWQVAQGLFAGGEINAAQLAEVRERLREIVLELQTMGVFVPEFGIIVDDTTNKVRTLGEQIEISLSHQAVAAAEAFGDALVDAAFYGGVSFKALFKQILADIAKAIVKMLILRALSTFSGPVGAIAGAAIGTVTAQHGGEVRGGAPGVDSVLAALTPGEVVLPRSRVDDFDAIADLASATREQGRGGAAVPSFSAAFQILPRRDDRDIGEIIEGISRLVERRGYRLIASEVLP
jgi:ABC-type transporter Mla subunit MlaD